jgi:type 1 glutamine amidotransferase
MSRETNRIKTFLTAGIAAILTATSIQAAEPAATRPAGEPAPTFLPVPPAMRKDIPAPRTRQELSRLIAERQPRSDQRKLHIVLVAGPKDHGPGEHDYPAWQETWSKLLDGAEKTKVTTAWEKPSAEQFKTADVMVLFKHFAWPKELNSDIQAFLDRGGGLVLLHFAVDGGDNGEFVGKCIGPYWGWGAKFRHGWVDLVFEDKPNEPFLRGLAGRTLRFHDETYWNLIGDPKSIEVLATGIEDDGGGKKITIPLLWNRTVGKGRVHVNILGHYNWSFNDPAFRVLVLRAIAWAAGEPVDRFDSLATIDADVKK